MEGIIETVLCLSGSLVPNVGQWISPNGSNQLDDQFEATVGDSGNPGSVQISTSSPLSTEHAGIYTCAIPDETGGMRYLHVGIYLNGFNGAHRMCWNVH